MLDTEAKIWPLCTISSSGKSALIKKKEVTPVKGLQNPIKIYKCGCVPLRAKGVWLILAVTGGAAVFLFQQWGVPKAQGAYLTCAHLVEVACLAPPPLKVCPQVIHVCKNDTAQQLLHAWMSDSR